MKQSVWFNEVRLKTWSLSVWKEEHCKAQETVRKSELALWHWSLTLQKQVNKCTMIRSQGHGANTGRKSELALWHWSLTLQKQVNKCTMIRSQGHREKTGRKSALALWHWSLTLQKQVTKNPMIRSQGHRANTGRKSDGISCCPDTFHISIYSQMEPHDRHLNLHFFKFNW